MTFSWPGTEFDQAVLLMGRRAASERLTIPGHTVTADAAQRLGLAGLLGQSYEARGRVHRPDAVDNLAQWQFAPAAGEPATVLRVSYAVRTNDPERPWMGWHESLPPEEGIPGVDRWWQLRHVEEGRLIVVTVAGFVVLVGRVAEVTTWNSLKRLHLAIDDDHPMHHTRLPLSGGGPVVELDIADDRLVASH
jgi:hypothetical protein